MPTALSPSKAAKLEDNLARARSRARQVDRRMERGAEEADAEMNDALQPLQLELFDGLAVAHRLPRRLRVLGFKRQLVHQTSHGSRRHSRSWTGILPRWRQMFPRPGVWVM